MEKQTRNGDGLYTCPACTQHESALPRPLCVSAAPAGINPYVEIADDWD